MWILNFFEFFLSFQLNNLCCATNSYSHWWIESETSCVHLRWSVLSGAVRAKSLEWMTNTCQNTVIQICLFQIKNSVKIEYWNAHKMQFVSVVFWRTSPVSCLSAYARVRWAHTDQWGSSVRLRMLRILTQQHHCSHSNKACLCESSVS